MYTRYGNSTVHALEKKVAALEGGEAAQAFGSGMAAISSAILSYVKSGDHLVAAGVPHLAIPPPGLALGRYLHHRRGLLRAIWQRATSSEAQRGRAVGRFP